MSGLRQRKTGCSVRKDTPPGAAAAHVRAAGHADAPEAAASRPRPPRPRSPGSLRGVLGARASGDRPGVVERRPRVAHSDGSSAASSASDSRSGDDDAEGRRRVRSSGRPEQRRSEVPRSRSDVTIRSSPGRLPYRYVRIARA